MLEIKNLVTGYGNDQIIRGISFGVPERSIAAILGHNGAGKSSVVRALVGLIPVWDGKIRLAGQDVSRMRSPDRVRNGIGVSFQDSCVFSQLSVAKNLFLGGYALEANRQRLNERAEVVLDLFPKLKDRYAQIADTLSGGERRMLSIGMALMNDPRLLVLDEPSTGLSPGMIGLVMEAIRKIRESHEKTVLLVEQNVTQALRVSDQAIVLKAGTVVFNGSPRTLSEDSTELIRLF